MNKLALILKSVTIALIITGCTSTPYETVDERPWQDQRDRGMPFLDADVMDEEW